MATRRARCTPCGRPMLVPLDGYATSIMCSGCQGFPLTRPRYPFVNNAPPLTNYPIPAYGRRDQFYHHQPWPQRAPPPPPPMTPPSAYGNKRVVLFGISYGNRVNRLKGSVNDVQCMKYFLIDKLGFPSDSIRMLTDDPVERNPLRIPTKHNMRMAMRWLVEGCQQGDSLVFHFSGHGSREVDLSMDELDGKGYYGWEDHRHPRAGYKGTRGGLAVCISACDDDGHAADTSAFSGMESAGALTYSFIQAMQHEPKLTYGRLLNAMRSTIRGAKEGTFGLNYQEHGLDNRQQHAHEPQLSSSEKFAIYSKSIVM